MVSKSAKIGFILSIISIVLLILVYSNYKTFFANALAGYSIFITIIVLFLIVAICGFKGMSDYKETKDKSTLWLSILSIILGIFGFIVLAFVFLFVTHIGTGG